MSVMLGQTILLCSVLVKKTLCIMTSAVSMWIHVIIDSKSIEKHGPPLMILTHTTHITIGLNTRDCEYLHLLRPFDGSRPTRTAFETAPLEVVWSSHFVSEALKQFIIQINIYKKQIILSNFFLIQQVLNPNRSSRTKSGLGANFLNQKRRKDARTSTSFSLRKLRSLDVSAFSWANDSSFDDIWWLKTYNI